ncbi:hypothetical protein WALSEDRAFT_67863 [Wallemia mellicola CBS 633.66]|uniref:Phosphoribosyltransferase domain-containing protein n=1 Tax=Wallemia mellicola (strain ATCC MYA-4683 / CBS 633.66) TaxID=671144 RepID=I4YG91_WALMC|nr:hypothetical protein WALSEDRAFT_67863 [Wallemia mellicola CBS 633.66]EIM22983.1 hypothetical protein WALSEDRAFT_67863 [Wallemia mellicola CBS 633.66]|eukprot:XP_006957024.1 hypothetical protein WALSEDRAFT_67863 [Wallemia mellicola CBS 633.66]
MVCQQLRHMPGSKNINATTRRISKTSTHSAEEMGRFWQTKHKINVPFAFDRKEAKKRGEGGNIIGAQFKGKVFVLEDVITGGTLIRHSINLIKNTGKRMIVE